MIRLVAFYTDTFERTERMGDWLLPLLARFIVAACLLVYYWHSGLTKLGDGRLGLFQPSVSAYAQIFPKQIAAVGFDASQLTVFHKLVVVAGTWAELLLPAMIAVGLATRLAGLGLMAFVAIQSLTDVFGHDMADLKTLGAWFDRFPDSVILDQRLFWIFVLGFLVVRGGGVLSLDALVRRRLAPLRGQATIRVRPRRYRRGPRPSNPATSDRHSRSGGVSSAPARPQSAPASAFPAVAGSFHAMSPNGY